MVKVALPILVDRRASVNVVISRISNAVAVTQRVAGVVSGISDRVRAVVKGQRTAIQKKRGSLKL